MARRESLANRLYTGDVSFGFIRHRLRWYIASGIVILVSILSLAIRGLTPSIDFKGGAQFSVPAQGHTVSQMQDALSSAGIPDVVVQTIGSGGQEQIRAQTPAISQTGQNNQRDRIVAEI